MSVTSLSLLACLLLIVSPTIAAQTAGVVADQLRDCDAMDDTGEPGARNCYLELLTTEDDAAIRAEALWRLNNTGAANRAFRRAAALDPGNADVLARWGLLFLSVHQAADAEALFAEALAIDQEQTEALLGQAELLANRFEGRATSLINNILDREPDHPRANILLARLHLEVADTEGAQELLIELLDKKINTRDRLDTYALLAAADHVTGEVNSQWTAKALDVNPKFGDIFAVPAYFYIITRRYAEAVELLEQAAKTDPEHWPAHADLGINLLRLNRFEQAREHLERAYEGDPYNAEVVNTLRLLDSLKSFDTLVSDNLILRVHASESTVLAPYVRDFVDNAEVEMATRYGYQLERPVVIELYQHHDDFAVRTAGLPGIGILGATFGDVIVMDGPSAKSAESFDWVSALWHELAHVVTLNATNNLVSRWFSEGVSVFEEWRYGPSPSGSVPLSFLGALAEEKLLPVAELDEGFMRPRYPEQISVSYLQAGLLCLFIADHFDGGLVGILEAYRDGATTVQAIERGLSMSAAELDDLFTDYLQERFGAVVGELDVFNESMRAAAIALEEERWADAVASAEEAVRIYPDYIGSASPHLLLARAAKEGRLDDKVMHALTQYWQAGGRNPHALEQLAQSYHSAARPLDAIEVQAVLARAVPFTSDYHATLGDWLSAEDRYAEALTEYQSVLALAPHDKADAHYKVALALHQLRRTEEARREVLYALEIAPRFRPALSLLVEINQ
jgi:tetratricopeptide (TPR) repeat protein